MKGRGGSAAVAGAALLLAVTAALSLATTARAGDGIFGLLRPGSRAAPGLGGDPFLSPLADESGWWAEPDFSRGSSVRLSAQLYEPVSRRASNNQGSLSGSNTAVGAVWSRGERWMLALEGIRPSGSARWTGHNGGLGYAETPLRAGAAARAAGVIPWITLQAAAKTRSDHGADPPAAWGAGVRLRPPAVLCAQASWQREEFPDSLQSDLYEEPMSASINLKRERWNADVGVSWRAWRLEASRSETLLGPRRDRTSEERYQMEPHGSERFEQYSGDGGGAGTRALLRWTRYRLNADGEASWGGQRFGLLSYARLEARSWLAGVSLGRPGRRWLIDGENVRCTGTGRGRIEFWPFAPTVIDLLGVRRTWKAVGEGKWWRLHCATDRRLGAAGALRLGLGWWDFRPEVTVQSWRPAFLSFGIADLRTSRMTWDRAQLLMLSAGATFALGAVETSIDLEQAVFARVFDRLQETPGPAPPGDSSGSSAGWRPGGSMLALSLTRRF